MNFLSNIIMNALDRMNSESDQFQGSQGDCKKWNLVLSLKRRQVSYLGHVLRYHEYNLHQIVITGKIARKEYQVAGKSQLRNIKEWTRIACVEELFNQANDKDDYNELIANLHYLERHHQKKTMYEKEINLRLVVHLQLLK